MHMCILFRDLGNSSCFVRTRVRTHTHVMQTKDCKYCSYNIVWGPNLYIIILQEVQRRSNCLLSFDTRRTAYKTMSLTIICCRGNVFTVPLPNNNREMHIEAHTLMGRIYEVCRWDGLRSHDVHTTFHKHWFRYSKVDRGEYMYRDIQTHTQTHREQGDLTSLLYLFKNMKSKLKYCNVLCHWRCRSDC
jgi:hypothetical protein